MKCHYWIYHIIIWNLCACEEGVLIMDHQNDNHTRGSHELLLPKLLYIMLFEPSRNRYID